MADVRLSIAGRFYDVNCSDGQEERLISLGSVVDEKARKIVGTTEVRQFLYAALVLADDLQEARSTTPKADPEKDALRAEAIASKAREQELMAALAEAEKQVKALELVKAEQREWLEKAVEAAEAAAAQQASLANHSSQQASSQHSSALAQIADRIEKLADQFEQLT
ncbi:MAG TPA: cell division protein ZapA [Sphingopyxis sp.]|nr:cell division protein ZapA [Sphingopyxis sp.]